MSGLYEKLKKYGEKNICPMHMPGHKRKIGLCKDIDITEIDGFDNLANPQGVLKELQDSWAEIYGADDAYISVNGSTGAILSAICGICSRGDKIIMARNCHKSVYNAVELMELEPVYIFPEYDEIGIAKGITKETVIEALRNNQDAKLLALTSPTYEGRISEIESICSIAHEIDIPVFVDSAHGAHIDFMNGENPIKQGADVVSVSLHKTLPAMTQTALLLVNEKRVSAEKIKEKLNIFQTSSPSYVLMASVSECLEFVKNNKAEFEKYAKNIKSFYDKARPQKLEIIKTDDMGKIVISTHKTDISGQSLMKKLRAEYGIELEMAYDNYALAMTSVCDRKEDLNRLFNALSEIDKKVSAGISKKLKYPIPKKCGMVMDKTETVLFSEANGKICASYIWAYPPGVPMIAPGEIIDEDVIEYITSLDETDVFGICDGMVSVYSQS